MKATASRMRGKNSGIKHSDRRWKKDERLTRRAANDRPENGGLNDEKSAVETPAEGDQEDASRRAEEGKSNPDSSGVTDGQSRASGPLPE